MRTGWVCAYEGDGAKAIIPPQLLAAQSSREEAQTDGDGRGHDADGGNHDDHRLTAIQTVDVGGGHGQSATMVDECWIRVPP